MDFGDILKQWDTMARVPPASKRLEQQDVRSTKESAKAQTAWIDAYGVPDPAERDPAPTDPVHPTRKDIECMPIDAVLDLHGMTTAEAELALESFFATAERSGCGKILIVHGKGLHSESEPVLAAFVTRWLSRRASAGRSGYATRDKGGRGATWVLMKDGRNQRSR
ncbi:MAG TPA: Smr/MutS family protein [bacterium]|nr:Smr/MutS family protein [bacterium]